MLSPMFPWHLHFFSCNLYEISKSTILEVPTLNKFWTRRCNSNRRSWLGRWAGEIDKSDFLFMSQKPERLERFQLCMSPNSIFKIAPFSMNDVNQPGKMSYFLSENIFTFTLYLILTIETTLTVIVIVIVIVSHRIYISYLS